MLAAARKRRLCRKAASKLLRVGASGAPGEKVTYCVVRKWGPGVCTVFPVCIWAVLVLLTGSDEGQVVARATCRLRRPIRMTN